MVLKTQKPIERYIFQLPSFDGLAYLKNKNINSRQNKEKAWNRIRIPIIGRIRIPIIGRIRIPIIGRIRIPIISRIGIQIIGRIRIHS